MKRKLAASLGAILIVVSAFVMITVANNSIPTVTVSIEDVAIGKGEEITLPIMIENLDGGMGANIILSFDPDVVQVLDITGGDFNLPLYTLIENDNGNAQHAVLNFPAGLSGDVVFANVTLEAIGEGGDTSPLDLEVVSLTDGVDEIAHEVDNGTFTVLNTIVSIEDVALGAGETTTVPIMIENLDGGMGANIILSFDPDVVQVLDITGGDFNLPLYTLIENDNGNAQHAVLNFPAGLSGDVVFANVTLEAIGEGGDTSPLDLEVVSLTDGVDEIAHEVDNGTFMVGEVET